MAKFIPPTVHEKILNFFREQLYRELSHMIKWDGLPDTVPADYLERNLVRHGFLLYYEDETIGQDILRCQVLGYNRHQLPVRARTFSPNTIDEQITLERNILRLADGGDVLTRFNPKTDGCVILNMEYGQDCSMIVDFYAEQLAMAQQAFNTNLLYANMPYIFQVSSNDTKRSIENMFSDIFSGKPFVIVDSMLIADNKERSGIPTAITFICKDIMDVINEIMMKFREAVGFNTSGVDKAERVNTLEIKSNDQHTQSVLDIMLQQRQIACDSINTFFKQNITVSVVNELEEGLNQEEGGEEDGTSDNGTEKLTED